MTVHHQSPAPASSLQPTQQPPPLSSLSSSLSSSPMSAAPPSTASLSVLAPLQPPLPQSTADRQHEASLIKWFLQLAPDQRAVALTTQIRKSIITHTTLRITTTITITIITLRRASSFFHNDSASGSAAPALGSGLSASPLTGSPALRTSHLQRRSSAPVSPVMAAALGGGTAHSLPPSSPIATDYELSTYASSSSLSSVASTHSAPAAPSSHSSASSTLHTTTYNASVAKSQLFKSASISANEHELPPIASSSSGSLPAFGASSQQEGSSLRQISESPSVDSARSHIPPPPLQLQPISLARRNQINSNPFIEVSVGATAAFNLATATSQLSSSQASALLSSYASPSASASFGGSAASSTGFSFAPLATNGSSNSTLSGNNAAGSSGGSNSAMGAAGPKTRWSNSFIWRRPNQFTQPLWCEAADAGAKLEADLRLCDSESYLDTLTLDPECFWSLESAHQLLRTLRAVSRGQFLRKPCRVKWNTTTRQWQWEEPDWFLDANFSLAMFAASRIEQSLWTAYFQQHNIDPRAPSEKRPYQLPRKDKPRDPLRPELVAFWARLPYAEQKKIVENKLGSEIAPLFHTEAPRLQNPISALSSLLELFFDINGREWVSRGFFGHHALEHNFVQHVFLTPLWRANTLVDRLLRKVSIRLANAYALEVANDLLSSCVSPGATVAGNSNAALTNGKSSRVARSSSSPAHSPLALSAVGNAGSTSPGSQTKHAAGGLQPSLLPAPSLLAQGHSALAPGALGRQTKGHKRRSSHGATPVAALATPGMATSLGRSLPSLPGSLVGGNSASVPASPSPLASMRNPTHSTPTPGRAAAAGGASNVIDADVTTHADGHTLDASFDLDDEDEPDANQFIASIAVEVDVAPSKAANKKKKKKKKKKSKASNVVSGQPDPEAHLSEFFPLLAGMDNSNSTEPASETTRAPSRRLAHDSYADDFDSPDSDASAHMRVLTEFGGLPTSDQVGLQSPTQTLPSSPSASASLLPPVALSGAVLLKLGDFNVQLDALADSSSHTVTPPGHAITAITAAEATLRDQHQQHVRQQHQAAPHQHPQQQQQQQQQHHHHHHHHQQQQQQQRHEQSQQQQPQQQQQHPQSRGSRRSNSLESKSKPLSSSRSLDDGPGSNISISGLSGARAAALSVEDLSSAENQKVASVPVSPVSTAHAPSAASHSHSPHQPQPMHQQQPSSRPAASVTTQAAAPAHAPPPSYAASLSVGTSTNSANQPASKRSASRTASQPPSSSATNAVASTAHNAGTAANPPLAARASRVAIGTTTTVAAVAPVPAAARVLHAQTSSNNPQLFKLVTVDDQQLQALQLESPDSWYQLYKPPGGAPLESVAHAQDVHSTRAGGGIPSDASKAIGHPVRLDESAAAAAAMRTVAMANPHDPYAHVAAAGRPISSALPTQDPAGAGPFPTEPLAQAHVPVVVLHEPGQPFAPHLAAMLQGGGYPLSIQQLQQQQILQQQQAHQQQQLQQQQLQQQQMQSQAHLLQMQELQQRHRDSDITLIAPPPPMSASTSEMNEQVSLAFPPILSFLNKNLITELHDDILRFYQYVSKTAQSNAPNVQTAIHHVQGVVLSIWPNSYVVLYGSYSYGLSLPHSDIDLVVVRPPMAPNSGAPAQSAVAELAARLTAFPWCSGVRAIETSRIPVVKFVATIGGLRIPVDVSFHDTSRGPLSHSGILARDFVRSQISAYPMLAPLVMVLKQYLHSKGLNEAYSGGLTSYGIVLLVTFLLQTNPPSSQLALLLLAFLDRFGNHFDSTQFCVSIRNKKIIQSNFPPNVAAIEDPHNAANNVGAPSFMFWRVQLEFRNALRFLLSSSQDAAVSRRSPYGLLDVLFSNAPTPKVDSQPSTTDLESASFSQQQQQQHPEFTRRTRSRSIDYTAAETEDGE
ncbi:hypothetical protein, variant [Capsaspora owczarzaki ATCC 30864]|nr:hypothetical protein, variant [Capsaspora owczarzaki ATCC 30864]